MLLSSTSNFWISSRAFDLTLNALGNPDFVQVSVNTGAVIMVYIEGIVGYDTSHNYQRWTIAAYPTVFSDASDKFLYARIPAGGSPADGAALLVYSSSRLDLFGQEIVEGVDNPAPQAPAHYFIYLGHISAVLDTHVRKWVEDLRGKGTLTTDQGLQEDSSLADWKKMFAWERLGLDPMGLIRPLKSFSRLLLGAAGKEINDVQRSGDTLAPSDTVVPTTAALQSFGDNKYLSKLSADTAAGEITFGAGLDAHHHIVLDGTTISKDEYGFVTIHGDLAVTGNVVAHAKGNHTTETITQAIDVDGTTISKDGGVLHVVGGAGGGGVDVDAMWVELAKSTAEQINTSHIRPLTKHLDDLAMHVSAADRLLWSKAAHDNREALDLITADKVGAWDAVATEFAGHTHSGLFNAGHQVSIDAQGHLVAAASQQLGTQALPWLALYASKVLASEMVVDGVRITKDKYGFVTIHGDLAVTGNVVAHATDGQKPQTLTEAIVVDGNTLSNEGGVLRVIGGGGGGGGGTVDPDMLWNELGNAGRNQINISHIDPLAEHLAASSLHIAASERTAWNAAATAAQHANRAVLDAITAEKVAAWDGVVTDFPGHKHTALVNGARQVVIDEQGNFIGSSAQQLGAAQKPWKALFVGAVSASGNVASKSVTLDGVTISKDEYGFVTIHGNLAVTGEVVSHVAEGQRPKTLTESLEVDGITISKEGGVLRVIGGAGGDLDLDAMWRALAGASADQVDISHLRVLTAHMEDTSAHPSAAKRLEWDGAVTESHHANRSTLDAITPARTAAWDGVVTDFAGHTHASLVNGGRQVVVDEQGNLIGSAAQHLGAAQKPWKALFVGAVSASGNVASKSVTLDGVTISKDKEGFLTIHGDLAVTGNVVAHATGGKSPATITQSIEVDGTTISKEGGVLRVIGGGAGGLDVNAMWRELSSSDRSRQVATAHLEAVSLPLQAHIDDDAVHLSAAQRSNLQSATDHVSAALPHVSSTERTNWNAAYSHSVTSGVHITEADRNKWNNAYTKAYNHDHSGIKNGQYEWYMDAQGYLRVKGNVYVGSDTVPIPRIYGGTLYQGGTALDSLYMKLSGGTFTGPVVIKGTAASLPLMTRNVVGSDGAGAHGDLYLQYGSTGKIYVGNGGAYTISADGSTYSGVSRGVQTSVGTANVARSVFYADSDSVNQLARSSNFTFNPHTGAFYVDGFAHVTSGARFRNICVECDANGANSAARASEINNYTSSLYLQHNTSNSIYMCSGGGSVGVGTLNPQTRLDVNGTIMASAGCLKSTFNGATIEIGSWNEIWSHYSSTSQLGHWFNKSVYVQGNVFAGDSYNRLLAFDDAVVHNSGGTMSGALTVNSTIKGSSLSSDHIRIEANADGVADSSRNGEINCYSSPLYLQYNSNQNVSLCSGGGKVGIGMFPEFKLDLRGSMRIGGITSTDMTFKSTTPQLCFGSLTEGGGYVQQVKILYTDWNAYRPGMGLKVIGQPIKEGGDYPLWFEVDGNIIATGEITAYSDARLKSDIRPLLDRGPLKPVSYVKDGKPSIGFLAQDVQEYYPELVTAGGDANNYLSLNYPQLTAVLSAQLNASLARISDLESRLSSLESRLAALEKN